MQKEKTNNQMMESELVSLVQHSVQNSVMFDTTFLDKNEKLLEQYLQMPYGDEIDGKSQVVTSEISDTVEADMTSLTRIFQADDNIFSFKPRTSNPDEIQEAEDKSKLVNYIIRNQKNSFRIINDWMKSAEIQKISALKYYIEETEEVETHRFQGVSESELVEIENSLESENVVSIEIDSKTEKDLGIPDEVKENIRAMLDQIKADTLSEEEMTETTEEEIVEAVEVMRESQDIGLPEPVFDVEFKVIKKRQEVKITPIPTENFIISVAATCKDDAEVVGDVVLSTRGELIAQGYPRELVEEIPSVNTIKRGDSINNVRDRGSNQTDISGEDVRDWASQEVELMDLYIKIDFDGDGIAERRHILMSGKTILENEVFNHVPYAILSSVTIPHSLIGRSRAEQVQQNQRVETVLLRQALDNTYMVNNTRVIANEDVELDDLLNVRPNGIVRVYNEQPVNQSVAALPTEYTADRTLMMMQHMDNRRANTSGQMIANQGLDKDAIGKETATRFEGVMENGAAKLELVARNFAETGFRELAEGICWLLSQYQDDEYEFLVLGKEAKVNPAMWTFNHVCEVAYKDKEKEVAKLQGLYMIQTQEKQMGSLLVDDQKIYNTLEAITKGLGMSDASKAFNNPSVPQEMLFAQFQQMQVQMAQMQAMLQQAQNPLAEAETIKAQTDLVEAEGKKQMDIAKLQEEQRQFEVKMAMERARFDEEMALKITELELQAKKDLNAQIADNKKV